MTLQAFQKGGLEIALAGAMALLLTGSPVMSAGSGQTASPAAVTEVGQGARGAEQGQSSAWFAGFGATVAGATVLVPFGLSMLRIRGWNRLG